MPDVFYARDLPEEVLDVLRELEQRVRDVVTDAGLYGVPNSSFGYSAERMVVWWELETPALSDEERKERFPEFFMTPEELGFNPGYYHEMEQYDQYMDMLAPDVYEYLRAGVVAYQADDGLVRVDPDVTTEPMSHEEAVRDLRSREDLTRWLYGDTEPEQEQVTPDPSDEEQTELEQAAQERPSITVYTTPGCMGCEMTRRQLDRAGVAYEAVDLSDRPDLVAQFRGEGLTSAPVVETPDGERTAGFRPDRIRAMVSAASAPGGQTSVSSAPSCAPPGVGGRERTDLQRGVSL